MAPRPLKRATTCTEQLNELRLRNMNIEESHAHQWLTNVSYYRLSAYWYPARMFNSDGTRLDEFSEGTTFTDAASLYEADRKLCTLVHDGMERIEISLRTRIIEAICFPDPLGHTDQSIFRTSFKHADWLDLADKRVQRAMKHNESIKHYSQEYGSQYPFWVLAEVLDFSDISRLFEGLVVQKQREIAESLSIKFDLSVLPSSLAKKLKLTSPLTSWLHQLTVIRNTCAHHSRLWNRSFTPAGTSTLRTLEAFSDLEENQSERIFGALKFMSALIRHICPGSTWPEKVASLLKDDFMSNPLVRPSALGVPPNWDGQL